MSRLPDGMLCERWIRAAIRSRNRRAVTQRPHTRVTATPQRSIDGDPATVIVRDRNASGDDARHDARSEHNRARINDLVRDAHTTGLDIQDRGRGADVGAAPLEHAGSHDRELRIEFGQNACTCLEQQEANVVASKPRIEAEHVIRERREFAEQLDTDEAAADHDDGEARATGRWLRGRVGSLELFNQVVSEHQRVRHRFEGERVR